MIKKFLLLLTTAMAAPMAQASLVATYTFNNTLDALQPGVVAITPIDPLGTSGFETQTVFGTTRTTYHFDGSSTPSEQGGLQLDTTGLIGTNNYSIEMVFDFADRQNAYRRILDSLDRASDAGLYVDPSNHLDVYPVGASGTPFASNTFYDVFLTVDSSNQITAYFSGVPVLTLSSSVMNLNSHFLNFFLDNTSGGGQGEWSNGNVALIKVFDTALSASEVAAETEDPFVGTATPEPAAGLLMIGGVALVAIRKYRARPIA